MTTDEARAALLVAFVGNATDGPIARELEPRIDALIAAVRAEEGARYRCDFDCRDCDSAGSVSAQELAALRDAGDWLWGVVANASGGDWSQQSEEWQTVAAMTRDEWFLTAGYLTTLAATPTEEERT